MKQLLNFIYIVALEINRVRAATYLAKAGKIEEAKSLL